MANTEFYTKGEKHNVVSRIDQVHTITLFCPLSDFGVQSLKNSFDLVLPQYKIDENKWKGVPTLDALNVFLYASSFQEQLGIEFNKDIIGVIVSSLKMFRKLKLINFEFTYDEEIENTYNLLLKKAKIGIKKYIYRVEKLEMNLSDLFSQNVIDMINKVFMYDGILPNSYLNRKFLIDFKFDDYVSFVSMFVGNNEEKLNFLDENICDYFNKFPPLVKEQKPDIRVITNYSIL